jgi:hypothetical protein
MDTPKRQLETALAPALKAAGYRKRALTWHRQSKDTISVFNLQKSQWGDQFYINCAIYLKALGTEETPPEYRCPVRARMDDLVPDRHRLIALLDFDYQMDGAARREEIVGFVVSCALPWLEKYSDIDQLRSLVNTSSDGKVTSSDGKVVIYQSVRDHFTQN